ncbi:unnamed protein product [Didymodactylos carnosus]|uniref:Tetratricopeptide repeat protein n=1 Tax=Didymodactylos carnosus TaxID=1234261 RepID=A0A814DXL1_9BILA|nr:unnamed protein product [Didymodactylos carnosus]CAF1065984.1 unnamed protein product [Didymodactylos carnosus]CAF3734755.1 unnamed protein product [Didymodactylos carnosus]CAF3831016.1 unnamed protein product [Didymodactylos carnosus]
MLYTAIAEIYNIKENYDQALTYLQQSLTIFHKCLPPDHFSIATTHANISIASHWAALYEQAARHYEKALDIALKCKDPANLQFIVTTHDNVAQTYVKIRDFKMGLYHAEQALQIRLKHHSPMNNVDLAMNYWLCATILGAMIQPKKSLVHLEKANAIIQVTDHPKLIKLRPTIEQIRRLLNKQIYLK